MKENRSFVKLFRNILDWGWYGDTNTFRVFMHILLKANYQETEYKGHKIPAGACVFGRKAWAEELGLSERQVRTAISHLESTNEIAIETTNRFSVITLVKWELWQIDEGRATNRTTNKKSDKRPTSDQQATTSKEYKNNNISSSLHSEDIYRDLPDRLVQTLKEFEQMRKEIKAPMSAKAKELLVAKLQRLAGDDTDMKIEILNQSIMNSWKGVFALKDGNDNGAGGSQRRGMGEGVSGAEEPLGKVKPPPIYFDLD